jgi:cation diffusion facilitator CzcD-associated flavoprotein CzcO
VTPPPGPAQRSHHVVLVGAGPSGRSALAALQEAGVTDVVMLDKAPRAAPSGHLWPGHEVLGSRFDDDTDTWNLTTTGGETLQAHVVIAAYRPAHAPFLPDIPGRHDFRGVSFHAAQWQPDFDATGKHVAVIGTDATAGHYLPQLTGSAAAVTVFAHPPRRIVPELPLATTRAQRWLARPIRRAADRRRSRPTLVGSAISSITTSSIRTTDGLDHDVDAIIYGTGFAIPDRTSDTTLTGAAGLSVRQAWDDGMEPYLGVAFHGFPNYFFVGEPDVDAQARFVADCVGLMRRTASTRIEVRRSSHCVFNERINLRPAHPGRSAATFKAFDLSSGARDRDETYDGGATLTVAGTEHPVRVRLAGHLDPIDGHYHWQGTVFSSVSQPLSAAALKRARTATVTIGARSAPARIVEETPWGTHTVAGVGAPPYPLS